MTQTALCCIGFSLEECGLYISWGWKIPDTLEHTFLILSIMLSFFPDYFKSVLIGTTVLLMYTLLTVRLGVYKTTNVSLSLSNNTTCLDHRILLRQGKKNNLTEIIKISCTICSNTIGSAKVTNKVNPRRNQ